MIRFLVSPTPTWYYSNGTQEPCTVYSVQTRLAESPECWSLKFQLDATFADNFVHICGQIMNICRQYYHI